MALSSRVANSIGRPNRVIATRPVRNLLPVTCQAALGCTDIIDVRSRASVAAFLAGASLLLNAGLAHASGEDHVAEFTASGLIFKDVVEVNALEDPEIEGVTIYFSDFKRNIVDKLAKDFFSEPSQASLTCALTGPVKIKDVNRISSADGSEVFSEQKGFNLFKNKTLRVRRIYDAKRHTVVYVAYSTRLSLAADDGGVSSGRYRTSLCTVTLPPPVSAPALVGAAAAAAP